MVNLSVVSKRALASAAMVLVCFVPQAMAAEAFSTSEGKNSSLGTQQVVATTLQAQVSINLNYLPTSRAYLVKGTRGTLLGSVSAPAGSALGLQICGGLDFMMGGQSGFAISAPYDLGGAGVVRIYDSSRNLVPSSNNPIVGGNPGGRFGSSLATGDFGFGIQTLAIGEPGGAGLVSFYDTKNFYPLTSLSGDFGFGYSLMAGDFGYSEGKSLLVGTESGNSVVAYHPTGEVVEVSQGNLFDGFGRAIVQAGDFVGSDGIGEVLIGAEQEDSSLAVDAGRVHIYDGSHLRPTPAPSGSPESGSSVTPVATLEGQVSGSRFGHSMAYVPGSPGYLVVGAPACGVGACSELPGAVYIYNAQTRALVTTLTMPGASIKRFGWVVRVIRNVLGNPNQYHLFVGVPANAQAPGQVRVYNVGNNNPASWSFAFSIANGGNGNSMGWAIAEIGTVANEQNRAVFAIGAPAVDSAASAFTYFYKATAGYLLDVASVKHYTEAQLTEQRLVNFVNGLAPEGQYWQTEQQVSQGLREGSISVIRSDEKSAATEDAMLETLKAAEVYSK